MQGAQLLGHPSVKGYLVLRSKHGVRSYAMAKLNLCSTLSLISMGMELGAQFKAEKMI